MPISDNFPQMFVNLFYIIIGLLIMYVGYAELNHYSISQFMALILINMGFITVVYGGYLMYEEYQ